MDFRRQPVDHRFKTFDQTRFLFVLDEGMLHDFIEGVHRNDRHHVFETVVEDDVLHVGPWYDDGLDT